MASDSTTTQQGFRIHPGVGIARLGDSKADFFVGPEAPGWRPSPPGGYKDAIGRIKRQAARFRVFEYDNDVAVREVTAFDATITWTVHLANKKASWHKFTGRHSWDGEIPPPLRNAPPGDHEDPDTRDALIIDGGPTSISGLLSTASIPAGAFRGIPVELGELRTDDHGRLMVLGGAGRSAPENPNNAIQHFANNDGWYDDTSDGFVRATIEFNNGDKFEADAAWVIVAPPKYVPKLDNLVTLDDTIRELYEHLGWLPVPPEVDFDRDIAPIFDRVADYAWVNAAANRGHGAGTAGDFKDDDVRARLRDNSDAGRSHRQSVLERVRVPLSLTTADIAERQASPDFMPLLSGDRGDAETGKPETWMTVLPSQYHRLHRWADGDFVTTVPAAVVPLSQIPVADQPTALDRGSLQPCVGGPFYPGIEMTFICQNATTWRAPYRLASETKPGDVTRWMALPWQADFYQCMYHWWPIQRPDEVLSAELSESVADALQDRSASRDLPSLAESTPVRVPWTRGLPTTAPRGDNAMVKYWSDLGFVEPLTFPSGEVALVERGRDKYAGLSTRDLFYALMNIDSHPDVLPAARDYVRECLSAARRFQSAPDTPFTFTSFEYTPERFANRLAQSYNEMVMHVDTYNPMRDTLIRSRSDLIERMRQYAPFNMTDGAWLRNVGNVGPMDIPHALSFSVLMDELGDGEAHQNHPNMYRDLLHSVGVYPSHVSTRDYVYDETLLDSAFDVPAFEMAISQFSQHFFPEILGMTVYLEFGIIEVKKTIALMRYFDIDPHYFVLHVGIDNPENGHSARAMKAVQLFLEEYAGTPEIMQTMWQRIWDGYVAFHMTGTFGSDLREHLKADRVALDAQVETMIASKREFGQLNHGHRELAGTAIDSWFADPAGFMQTLIDAGYFIPGYPDSSRFFKLTTFDGPMYRVFTDAELKLWADWCRSIGKTTDAPEPADPYRAMVTVVEALRLSASDVPEHETIQLIDPDDQDTSHSVQWWLTRPSAQVLAVLASPHNRLVVPDKPADSVFLTDFLSESNRMGKAFNEFHLGGTRGSARQAVINWISAGCPTKPFDGPITPLWLAATTDQVAQHPTEIIVGMGAIH